MKQSKAELERRLATTVCALILQCCIAGRTGATVVKQHRLLVQDSTQLSQHRLLVQDSTQLSKCYHAGKNLLLPNEPERPYSPLAACQLYYSRVFFLRTKKTRNASGTKEAAGKGTAHKRCTSYSCTERRDKRTCLSSRWISLITYQHANFDVARRRGQKKL